jgi:hypothetical protein
VTRPEIYFGEMTNTDVYVKTRQQEFNYPEGQSNNLTSYEGTAASCGRLPAPHPASHSTAAISPSCPSATM